MVRLSLEARQQQAQLPGPSRLGRPIPEFEPAPAAEPGRLLAAHC